MCCGVTWRLESSDARSQAVQRVFFAMNRVRMSCVAGGGGTETMGVGGRPGLMRTRRAFVTENLRLNLRHHVGLQLNVWVGVTRPGTLRQLQLKLSTPCVTLRATCHTTRNLL